MSLHSKALINKVNFFSPTASLYTTKNGVNSRIKKHIIFRVIVYIEDKIVTITVVEIGHRREVYDYKRRWCSITQTPRQHCATLALRVRRL